MEEGEKIQTDLEGEQTVGVEISANGRRAYYIPGCAKLHEALVKRLASADLLLFDGTVFYDDEMEQRGAGSKTGRRMGHIPMDGPEGSLKALASVNVKRKVYVHINNTNPVWDPASWERSRVEQAGWEVARDGMEITV